MDPTKRRRRIGKSSGIVALVLVAGCHPVQVVQPGTQMLITQPETIHRPAVLDPETGEWVRIEHNVTVPPGYGIFLPDLEDDAE